MEETIELREIIEILLKGKWIIATITVICMLLAGIASWFILPEKFESKAVVQINAGVQDTGVVSNFVATVFTPEVFTERVNNEPVIDEAFQKESFINSYNNSNLSISSKTNSNLLTLKYTSNSPENAQQELQTILSVAKEEMSRSVQTALQELNSTYQREAESLSQEIEAVINDYNSMVRNNRLPDILILQTILNTEMVIDFTGDQQVALTNVSGALQNELLQLQTQIRVKSSEYQNVLAKYQSAKTELESFNPEPFVRTIVKPSLADGPSSPNKMMNLAIAFVIGIMLGVGIVFFRNYWRSTAPVNS